MGWVNSYRDQGQLLFIHLRDREGITQIVFDEGINAELLAKAKNVRREFVIAITGECIARDQKNFNPVMATGEVEVAATEIKFLNDAQTPPFELENTLASEELRLKYRYLDLRRLEMQKNFRLRHKITLAVRDYLDSRGFFEIETPILTKSTPEGARDYLVPARTAPGKFYALPQSPQLFKQLLMIAGYDKYFQIARCFRDEDLRADRQPEFTQIDMEMSFVQPDDVFAVVEPMVCACFKAAGLPEPATPFPRMDYHDAMNLYGSDKPDLRFELPFHDLSATFKDSAFPVFAEAVAKGGAVKAIVVPGAASWSRKQYDEIIEHAKRHGAGGLAYIQVLDPEPKSALNKFMGLDGVGALIKSLGANTGDSILMIGGKWDVACNAMGQVRLEVARRENLIREGENKLLWVVNFPMFEYHEDDRRWYAMHHPFTSPKDDHVALLASDPGTEALLMPDTACWYVVP